MHSFLNVRSEVLLHTLEDRQIYVSAGSACSSHKRAGSPTLTAIGASKAEMESARAVQLQRIYDTGTD